MKKSLKSYVLCLTTSLAAAGMLVGCGNQASILPEIVTIDTLEEEKPANDSTDPAEKDATDNGQTETAGEILDENSTAESEDTGDVKELGETGTVGDFEYILEGSMDSGFFLDRGWFLMASGDDHHRKRKLTRSRYCGDGSLYLPHMLHSFKFSSKRSESCNSIRS